MAKCSIPDIQDLFEVFMNFTNYMPAWQLLYFIYMHEQIRRIKVFLTIATHFLHLMYVTGVSTGTEIAIKNGQLYWWYKRHSELETWRNKCLVYMLVTVQPYMVTYLCSSMVYHISVGNHQLSICTQSLYRLGIFKFSGYLCFSVV